MSVTFAELLTRLGYGTHRSSTDEHVSICHQLDGGSFTSDVVPWDHAPGLVAAIVANYDPRRDFWFGVNALGEVTQGRGKEADVTRLTALYADLDIKPGACPDMSNACDIIDDVSAILGERPCAVSDSGHGLHSYWPLDVSSALTLGNREAKGLLETVRAVDESRCSTPWLRDR